MSRMIKFFKLRERYMRRIYFADTKYQRDEKFQHLFYQTHITLRFII